MLEGEKDFARFFEDATGFSPYRWQIKAAVEGLPEVLPIPTGLGKTDGSVLAWAWRKLRLDLDEPLHLIYCLPMRSLVRQTVERVARYFTALTSKQALPNIPVYQLMGGAIEKDWASWPDRAWVLVGTQDQLLSRALNRGYAMDRFMWPVHFGLLNHDCHWIIDETQLMGPGLWTTAQLDWMRRKRFLSLKTCRTTWMSATLGAAFLQTVDRKKDGLDTFKAFNPCLDEDKSCELKRRHSARRSVDFLRLSAGKKALALHEQIVARAQQEHCKGALTLVVCNTVKTAQQIFRSLAKDGSPKILLTSRFRAGDRRAAEQKLADFEARRRKSANGRIDGDAGLFCVSTQVVEAGLDISAHRLWSELAPWASVVQRLGRLNRDGRDDDAMAYFWEAPNPKNPKRDGDIRIGPYLKEDLKDAKTLLDTLMPPLRQMAFTKAMEIVREKQGTLLDKALQPRFEPCPRALDLHGLFSTEQDVHGGFTDVSRFVRGPDPDADLVVFWRDWSGTAPPEGEALDGPPFDPQAEGCPVAVYRLCETLKTNRARAWIWNDEEEKWESCALEDLRSGMTVMLRGDVGGYDVELGWTGDPDDRLQGLPPPGAGRAFRDDERVETGGWSHLDAHLKDVRTCATEICDAVGLREDDPSLKPFRVAVIEAAGLHDLGKVHPDWQEALPARGANGNGPWAKCPSVLKVEAGSADAALRAAIIRLTPGSRALPDALDAKTRGVLLRWAVNRKLNRTELDQIRKLHGVRRAAHQRFRPGLRHEAATALAMWRRYRDGQASYPALAVYLAAAHHGKVRTVLRASLPGGGDVFGVRGESAALNFAGEQWPLDFSVAADGAEGEWRENDFVLTGHGWTGLVADLLGQWRGNPDGACELGVVPECEPRWLGSFVLAWLEALVRAADWRASEHPSQSIRPGDGSHGG